MDIVTKLNSRNIENLEINYFKESTVVGEIILDSKLIDILNIVDSSIDIIVNTISLLDSSCLISNEGQRLTGKALLIDYDINISIKYIKHNNLSVLYNSFKESGNSCYIIIPNEFNNIPIERIINNKFYSLATFIENQEVSIVNSNSICYAVTSLLIFYPLKN